MSRINYSYNLSVGIVQRQRCDNFELIIHIQRKYLYFPRCLACELSYCVLCWLQTYIKYKQDIVRKWKVYLLDVEDIILLPTCQNMDICRCHSPLNIPLKVFINLFRNISMCCWKYVENMSFLKFSGPMYQKCIKSSRL